MEQYIYDGRDGLWYEQNGDYYLPCLKLPEIKIGIWGERHLTYIQEHKKLLRTIKSIRSNVSKAYLVVPDEIVNNNKELEIATSYNHKILNKEIFSSIGGVYLQEQIIKKIKEYGLSINK